MTIGIIRRDTSLSRAFQCPGQDLNLHAPEGTADFKSAAAANYATRARAKPPEGDRPGTIVVALTGGRAAQPRNRIQPWLPGPRD